MEPLVSKQNILITIRKKALKMVQQCKNKNIFFVIHKKNPQREISGGKSKNL